MGLSALTVAEYFREDLQQDVLLFIDNIFRVAKYLPFLDASHRDGRLPSGCQGYRPCSSRG